MNFNAIVKERREKLFGVKYPCACQFRCERFGGDIDCDNCSYCGTDGRDQYRPQSELDYLSMYSQK